MYPCISSYDGRDDDIRFNTIVGMISDQEKETEAEIQRKVDERVAAAVSKLKSKYHDIDEGFFDDMGITE